MVAGTVEKASPEPDAGKDTDDKIIEIVKRRGFERSIKSKTRERVNKMTKTEITNLQKELEKIRQREIAVLEAVLEVLKS